MSKRLIYICSHEAKSGQCSKGVCSKMKCQMNQFKSVGYETSIQAPKVCGYGGWMEIINPFSSVLDWSHVRYKGRVDAVYIRLVRIDFPFLKLLAKLKRYNPNIKILFEFPSYPYKGEMFSSQRRLLYYKDCFYSTCLRFFVDRIILPAPGYKKLFGIKVLYVPNGIEYDYEKVPLKRLDDGEIHLLAVASMCVWHGYDRIIRGLANYYKSENTIKVVLHLAGIGPELEKYQQLVKKYHIAEYVIFEGFCEGEKLDELYKKCHIGVGSLGVHRTWDGKVISSLKLKEYALKGLPFILEGFCDMESRETRKYILRVSSDEAAIDIYNIIEFYQKVYDGKSMVNNEIKEKFRKFYDMKKVFKPVTDFLNS